MASSQGGLSPETCIAQVTKGGAEGQPMGGGRGA